MAGRLSALQAEAAHNLTTEQVASRIAADYRLMYDDNANMAIRSLAELGWCLLRQATDLAVETAIPYWPPVPLPNTAKTPAPPRGGQATLPSGDEPAPRGAPHV
ncbi:MAG: hypothetical protein QOI63_987 [Thermoplasmata archaeon]|jgi:hypothetical protein|nr:hypothetical protein [Thermoplasmata archaeon]